MLGYYMSDKRLKLNLVRGALAAGLVALVAFGVVYLVDYFTHLSEHSKHPKALQFALAAVVALPLWIVVGWVEWRKWIGQSWSRLRRKPARMSASNESAASLLAQDTPPR